MPLKLSKKKKPIVKRKRKEAKERPQKSYKHQIN
jgi:hypothetical protein